jgi:AbrB family looped-hinge helix DNA binding protein
MNEIKEIKTVTITEKGQIAIPKLARKIKGFNEGSKLSLLVYKDKIELRPMKKISDVMMAMLASEEVLSESWNTKEEDESWKNL